MDIEVFLIVLFATVIHAVWNAMVKNHSNKTVAVSAIVLGHVPLSVVAIILFPFTILDPSKFWFRSKMTS